MLTPEEQHFLRSLGGLPLAPAQGLVISPLDRATVAGALGRVDEKLAEMVGVGAQGG